MSILVAERTTSMWPEDDFVAAENDSLPGFFEDQIALRAPKVEAWASGTESEKPDRLHIKYDLGGVVEEIHVAVTGAENDMHYRLGSGYVRLTGALGELSCEYMRSRDLPPDASIFQAEQE